MIANKLVIKSIVSNRILFNCHQLILASKYLKTCNIFNRTFHTSLACCNNASYIDIIENAIKHLKVYDEIDLRAAKLDWNYLLDEKNASLINENTTNRKGTGNIFKVHSLFQNLKELLGKSGTDNELEIHSIIEEMYFNASSLPNKTHEDVPIGDYDKCETVIKIGEKLDQKNPTIEKISKFYGWFREEQLSFFSTQRAYILQNELADLEVALVKYTLDCLNKKGFVFVSVPDILHHSIIESCGFQTKGDRNQVYKLDYLNEYGKYCMSGTSEMALAGLLKNRTFNSDELPLKLCAVSRCFRAEVSGSEREGKLYRLHEFTKVEMFIITLGDLKTSNQMLEEIKEIQLELFSDLGLHFKLLNMSSQELGSPAFKKYDIETWMPGNQFYGEISSSSNCTDYQSRRLHIKYKEAGNKSAETTDNFVHTLNGTACAIPRMLTCIIESNWDAKKKHVRIPEKLRAYMKNKEYLIPPKDFRRVEPLKNIK